MILHSNVRPYRLVYEYYSQYYNRYMQQNITNIQRTTVGQTLADIVDGCILGAEGKANIQLLLHLR